MVWIVNFYLAVLARLRRGAVAFFSIGLLVTFFLVVRSVLVA